MVVIVCEHRMGFYGRFVKRMLDFILSFLAFIGLAPIMLIIGIFVRAKLGNPVIFKQARPGKGGKLFYMYKFRTMTDERSAEGDLLPDEIRLTEFGQILRKTSLDELPELLNIIKGDMSIVGPRPQLVCDMVFMTPEQNRRHEVRQGLTGLAQIKGRNAVSWEEKLKYDLEYVAHITFWNDLKIIAGTVKAVLRRDGINTEGMATAEDFGDYLLRMDYITKDLYLKKQEEAKRLIGESACLSRI